MICSHSQNETTLNDSHQASSSTTRQRGLSLIELVVAVVIMMILAAIGIPQVMNAVYASRIRSAAVNVSALIQQARATAEKRNVTVPFYVGNVGTSGVAGAFIGCSASICPGAAAWAAGDPYLPYAGGIQNSVNPPAALTQAALGFTTQPAGTTLYFTPLGSISNAAAGTYTSQGFTFYLTDGQNRWSAVSVSPTGRSKVWIWTGSWH